MLHDGRICEWTCLHLHEVLPDGSAHYGSVPDGDPPRVTRSGCGYRGVGERTRGGRGRPRYQDVLTPAEWRVADAVRQGLSNRQIAARRAVSLDAVRFHVANAIAKLGLGSRARLRDWAGFPRTAR